MKEKLKYQAPVAKIAILKCNDIIMESSFGDNIIGDGEVPGLDI